MALLSRHFQTDPIRTPLVGGRMHIFGPPVVSYVAASVPARAHVDAPVQSSGPVEELSGGFAFVNKIKEVVNDLANDPQTAVDLRAVVADIGKEVLKSAGKQLVSQGIDRVTRSVPERREATPSNARRREAAKPAVERASERRRQRRQREAPPNEVRRLIRPLNDKPTTDKPAADNVSGSGNGRIKLSKEQVFCPKCRGVRDFVDEQIVDFTTKKGMKGKRLAAKCKTCGGKVSKILSTEKKASDSNEATKTKTKAEGRAKRKKIEDRKEKLDDVDSIIASELGLATA